MTRECPHCRLAMRPDLETCPSCGRGSELWIRFENTWWTEDERGGWLRYEPFSPPTGWRPWAADAPPWELDRGGHAIAVAGVS